MVESTATAMAPEPEALEPELTASSYMALAMIRDGVDTGYRIKQTLERVASFVWSASYGQIYPELRRLEAAGLVSGREVTEGGRLRREYSLTERGERRLRRWLEEPAEPSFWLRNEGLLRLMLIDWEDDPELVRKNLREHRRSTAARLETIRALEPPRERGRRIQSLGIRLLEATVRWCDETEAALGDGDG